MTRLYFSPEPGRRFVAEFDGDDAPLLSCFARHGHPVGAEVSSVDLENGTYQITDGISVSEFRVPSRWFDLDDDDKESPGLVIHDSDTVTVVPFVPCEAAP